MSWPDYPSGFNASTALTCASFVQQAYFQLFANADTQTPPAFPPPFGFPAYSTVLQMPPSGYTLQYTIQYPSESAPFDYFGYVVTGPSVINSGATMTAFVLRGTESPTEWMDDILLANQTEFSGSLGLVHEGFNTIYGGLTYVSSTGSTVSLNDVLSDTYSQASATDLVVTGHSLGGALATLMAIDIVANQPNFASFTSPLSCYTFGSPQVGDPATFVANFNSYITQGSIANYRVANGLDIVPTLPPNVYYDVDFLDPSNTVTEYDYAAVNGFCPISSGLVDFDFHSLNAYAAGLDNLINLPASLAVARPAARRRRPLTKRLPHIAVPRGLAASPPA